MMPMKGLLKGLRYISQIFDNEKEEDIQIGFPTDVKHVAHIGMDGPSANTPSWMNSYNANGETSSAASNCESKQKPATKSSREDSGARNTNETHKTTQKSSSATLDSPTQRSSGKIRHSRRNHTSSSSVDSQDEDSSELNKPFDLNKPRRHKHSGDINSPRRLQIPDTGTDSHCENPPRVPKSRRKKSKGSLGSGSMRSSRSKNPEQTTESFSNYSDPGPNPEFKNNEVCSNSKHEEGNDCEDISRGVRAL